jgi:hypothetical protein
MRKLPISPETGCKRLCRQSEGNIDAFDLPRQKGQDMIARKRTLCIAAPAGS